MKKTITEDDFVEAFDDYNRLENRTTIIPVGNTGRVVIANF